MQVADLMSAEPEVVPPDASLHEVLAKMNRSGFRHLPVVDGEVPIGIITDRDIRLAINSPVIGEDAVRERKEALDGISVGECMTPDPQCVASDTPLHEVADLLSLNKFGAMPVVEDGRLVGMISYIDFLKHYAANR